MTVDLKYQDESIARVFSLWTEQLLLSFRENDNEVGLKEMDDRVSLSSLLLIHPVTLSHLFYP